MAPPAPISALVGDAKTEATLYLSKDSLLWKTNVMGGIHHNIMGLMNTPLPNAHWSNLKNASGKSFDAPPVNPDSVPNNVVQTAPDRITHPAKGTAEKWKGMSRDQAWNELESHSIIPKGIDRNNRYTSKAVDDFISTMKQRISNLNPNNIEDAKHIMRLKNGMDVAQHLGKVPSTDELSKMLS